MNMNKTSMFPNAAINGAALVTGGGQRIGRAISLELAKSGWAVAIHYMTSASAAKGLVKEIEKLDGKALAISADLRDPEAVDRLIPSVERELGPVTCLVNNASVFDRDEVRSATLNSWQSHIDVNLRAPFFLIQSFANQVPVDSYGQVINIIDERVWNLTPHFSSYTVSKAGLWTLTQTCALALSPKIRVNAIGPGPTLPNKRQSWDQFKIQRAATPLGIGATPEEIASAIKFILSAPAMTGQMIALDGGQHLKWRRYPDDPDLIE